MAAAQDWLAFIPMGCGGSWARGKDRDDTIRRAARMCRSDWGGLYRFDGAEVDILVADVRGHDHVCFDSSGIWTEPESSDGNSPADRTYLDKSLVEVVRHTYSKRGRPRHPGGPAAIKDRMKKYQQRYYLAVTKPKRQASR